MIKRAIFYQSFQAGDQTMTSQGLNQGFSWTTIKYLEKFFDLPEYLNYFVSNSYHKIRKNSKKKIKCAIFDQSFSSGDQTMTSQGLNQGFSWTTMKYLEMFFDLPEYLNYFVANSYHKIRKNSKKR